MAYIEDVSPEWRSASEITTGPSIVTAFLNSLATAEINSGKDAMSVSTADGTSTSVADSESPSQFVVLTGHTPCSAR